MVFASAALAACGRGGALEVTGAAGAEAVAAAGSAVITCTGVTLAAGTIGQGQSVSTLARRELSGTQDVWTQYVELSGGSDATFTFPTALDPAEIAGLAVQVNYRGSLRSYVPWFFELWDAAAGAWVPVGDNGFAQDWVWSAAVLPVPGPPQRFLSGGSLRLRYHAGNTRDASLLDELVIVATLAAPDGGAGDGGPAADAGGPPDAGPITDAGAGADAGAPDAGGGIWSPAPGTAGNAVITCTDVTLAAGTIGQGQSVSTLARRELSGTQDVWTQYVELSGGSDATFTFPTALDPAEIAGLAVQVNYRGSLRSYVPWFFELWDAAAGAWVPVGDNGFAQDWVWSAAVLPVPGPPQRFLSGGSLRLRYHAGNTRDASLLDELVIVATLAAPDGGAGDGGPAADAGGPPDAGPIADADAGPIADADAGPIADADAGPIADAGAAADAGAPDAGGGIWSPAPGTSWQIQLTGALDTRYEVAMYDLDLFDVSASQIAGLKAQGRDVICYFSAGSYEDWRPDANQFPASALGRSNGWPGERWLDIRNATVRDIMKHRLDLAVQKGCTGVDPDNVDGYTNSTGFSLTAADQLDYNRFLAAAAHARGLAAGLKNDVEQVAELVASFEFAVNEECVVYSECDLLLPFIRAGKPVFHIEYDASLRTEICAAGNSRNFDTLIKDLDLSAARTACR